MSHYYENTTSLVEKGLHASKLEYKFRGYVE